MLLADFTLSLCVDTSRIRTSSCELHELESLLEERSLSGKVFAWIPILVNVIKQILFLKCWWALVVHCSRCHVILSRGDGTSQTRHLYIKSVNHKLKLFIKIIFPYPQLPLFPVTSLIQHCNSSVSRHLFIYGLPCHFLKQQKLQLSAQRDPLACTALWIWNKPFTIPFWCS